MEVDIQLEILERAGDLLSIIREEKPLVHHISNPVTINDSANIVLALGASPIMADDPSELEDVVSASSSLVLNTGMPNNKKLHAMILAGKRANALKIPVIIDPVGVGFTGLRKQFLIDLLASVSPSVIKGNQAEIAQLGGINSLQRGVDSAVKEWSNAKLAESLAIKYDCVVAMTGKSDIVTDGKTVLSIDNGHHMLSQISGTGCMSASIIGAFCGVSEDCLLSAAGAMLLMGISGERANERLNKDQGIGSFKVNFFDEIYGIDKKTLMKRGQIHVL